MTDKAAQMVRQEVEDMMVGFGQMTRAEARKLLEDIEIDAENRRQEEARQKRIWQNALKRRQMFGQYKGAADPEPCDRCYIRHAGECY